MAETAQLAGAHWVRAEHVLYGGRFEQPLQHSAGSPVLQTLVRGQTVLRAVPAMAEFAHVQRVRLLVLVLKMSFQRVVARECAMAVGTLLRLVDATAGRWWHSQLSCLPSAAATALVVAIHLCVHVAVTARTYAVAPIVVVVAR